MGVRVIVRACLCLLVHTDERPLEDIRLVFVFVCLFVCVCCVCARPVVVGRVLKQAPSERQHA